jgi:hypothetical protein
LPPDIEETFKMAPRVSPIFPAEGAFEIDVATPDGRTLPLRSGEIKAVIERRARVCRDTPVQRAQPQVFPHSLATRTRVR